MSERQDDLTTGPARPAAPLTRAERIARHRRLARVFGEGLPQQTRDDLPEPGEREGNNDEWLRRQVPPHHG